MFTPSRQQARDLFFNTWEKYRTGLVLEGLEQTVLEIVLLHPEYQELLENRDKHFERDYLPETGQLNPFLHMSLHLAVAEQLAVNQPPGIADAFNSLMARYSDRHSALHVIVDCLGETVWQANRSGSTPDQHAYLRCLQEHLDKT